MKNNLIKIAAYLLLINSSQIYSKITYRCTIDDLVLKEEFIAAMKCTTREDIEKIKINIYLDACTIKVTMRDDCRKTPGNFIVCPKELNILLGLNIFK